MPMICVSVVYTFVADRVGDVLKLVDPLIAATRAEPGCRMYIVHQATTEPATFLLYEQYDDEAALDAHRASPHFERYVKNGLMPLAKSRTAGTYTPVE